MKSVFYIAGIAVFVLGVIVGRKSNQPEIVTHEKHFRDTVIIQLPAPLPEPPKIVYYKTKDTLFLPVNDSLSQDVTAWTFEHTTERDGDSLRQEITFFGPPLEYLNVRNFWNGNSIMTIRDSSVVTRTVISSKRFGWGLQLGIGVNQSFKPTVAATIGVNWRW